MTKLYAVLWVTGTGGTEADRVSVAERNFVADDLSVIDTTAIPLFADRNAAEALARHGTDLHPAIHHYVVEVAMIPGKRAQ